MHAREFRTCNMTGTGKARKRAALGVRAHSGWAAVILLCGSANEPEIIHRGRIELCDGGIDGSKQLFHAAEPMAFRRAEGFIKKCKSSTEKLADKAVSELMDVAKVRGLTLSACGVLTASGRALPALKDILASHALIHVAEGEFYRDVVAEACARSGIRANKIKEREIADLTASRLKLTEGKLKQKVDALGKPLGPPWTADQKLSLMAAWLTLAS